METNPHILGERVNSHFEKKELYIRICFYGTKRYGTLTDLISHIRLKTSINKSCTGFEIQLCSQDPKNVFFSIYLRGAGISMKILNRSKDALTQLAI